MLVNSAIRPRWDPDSQGCSGHFVPGSSALWSCGALPESPVNLAIASFLFSLITSVPREHTWVHTVLLPTHLSLFSAQVWLSSPQRRILTCSFHKLFDLADLCPCLSPLSSRVSNCPVRWGLQQHFLPGSVLVCENLEDYCFLLSGVSSFWWSQFMWVCAILHVSSLAFSTLICCFCSPTCHIILLNHAPHFSPSRPSLLKIFNCLSINITESRCCDKCSLQNREQ